MIIENEVKVQHKKAKFDLVNGRCAIVVEYELPMKFYDSLTDYGRERILEELTSVMQGLRIKGFDNRE